MGPACGDCWNGINKTACLNRECVTANGVPRAIMTINRSMPGPTIELCFGDTAVVRVENHLTTGGDLAIHWHGLLQIGTPYYDGVPSLTQCAIPQGTSFVYQFKAHEIGTYFYHSHHGMQKMDGLFGMLIIRDSDDPSQHFYDTDDSTLFLNDWSNNEASALIPGVIDLPRRGQQPDSLLINGLGQFKDNLGVRTKIPGAEITISKDGRHRFRVVNSGCFECQLQLFIQDHQMKIIAMDGWPIQPVTVDSIIVLSGERVDFVLERNRRVRPKVHWIVVRGLADCALKQLYQTAVVKYEGARDSLTADPGYQAYPSQQILNPMGGACGPGEGGICAYQLKSLIETPLPESDHHVEIPAYFTFYNYQFEEIFGQYPITHKSYYIPFDGNETFYLLQAGVVNNVSNVLLDGPPLSQPYTLDNFESELRCDRDLYRQKKHQNCYHQFHVPLNSIVRILFVHDAEDSFLEGHPFHCHGYKFRIRCQALTLSECLQQMTTNDNPIYKDTVNTPGSGVSIVDFYADNPGFWLCHCHVIHHQLTGMSFVLRVGEYSDLPPVPCDFPTCGNFQQSDYCD